MQYTNYIQIYKFTNLQKTNMVYKTPVLVFCKFECDTVICKKYTLI